MRCAACNKRLHPDRMLMFELSLEDGKPVKKAQAVAKGFTCIDLMCLAIATGCSEDEPS